jgi:hypothetical protein
VPVRACPWMRELCVGWHSTFLEDLKWRRVRNLGV